MQDQGLNPRSVTSGFQWPHSHQSKETLKEHVDIKKKTHVLWKYLRFPSFPVLVLAPQFILQFYYCISEKPKKISTQVENFAHMRTIVQTNKKNHNLGSQIVANLTIQPNNTKLAS
jgi:hypothetical protein